MITSDSDFFIEKDFIIDNNKVSFEYLSKYFKKYNLDNIYFIIDDKSYNIKRISVLSNFKEENLNLKPYPHIIIDKVLDENIYQHLDKTYISDNDLYEILGKKRYNRNARYDIRTTTVLENNKFDSIWKIFSFYHSSEYYVNELRSKFGEKLFDSMDHFKYKNIKHFRDLTIGIRNSNKKYDIETECQIGINTPSDINSHVKGPHIDNLNEVYAGLFYMKQSKDQGNGGNLEVYKTIEDTNEKNFSFKIKLISNKDLNVNGETYSRKRELDPKLIEKVSNIEYGPNKFVCFLNTINAIHGVSTREKNIVSRRLVNIIGELYYPSSSELFKNRAPGWS